MAPDTLRAYLQQNPQVQSIRVAAADLNGVARGKRLPVSHAGKAISGGLRFPKSVLNLDILGQDIEDSPLVFQTGDQDGGLQPTERGFVPMPWLDQPAALLPVWMFDDTGAPFEGDPRHALKGILDRYRTAGLTPVVAMEFEVFLVDGRDGTFQVPRPAGSVGRHPHPDTLSLDALDRFEPFFNALYSGCERMGLPADAAISESGRGQFEINLMHSNDALQAADNAWLFKMLVKGVARQHGFAATFMAKPYADTAGSGLHTHFSILDHHGQNVFDDGTDLGTATLRHAIGGCLNAMADSSLIFAPHQNSYDRLVPEAHAPIGICWGYENRTAALRVPGGSPTARRIEHRTPGGDTNPYLTLAALLGAALDGIAQEAKPPSPITGNAYALDVPHVHTVWTDAISAFEHSAQMKRLFPAQLIRNYVLTKRQELRCMGDLDAAEQMATYLESV